MVIFNPYVRKNAGISSFIKRIPGIPIRPIDILKSSEQYKKKIKQYLEEYGIKAEISQSASAGDALRIARQCSISGYDLVIAAGGDGTINAVINGLAGSETVFGAILSGYGKCFRNSTQSALDPRSACELIAKGRVRKIDLGKAETQYFSCLAGIDLMPM